MALKPSGLAIGSLLQRMSRGESDPKLLAEALRQVQDAVWRLEQAAPAAEPTAASFTDRGDPAAVDKAVGNFTIDDAWHDWDLGGIVPVGAMAILIRLKLVNTSGGPYIKFRKNGNSNDKVAAFGGVVSSSDHWTSVIVPCDSGRVIEYYAWNAGTWVILDATVAGWWK